MPPCLLLVALAGLLAIAAPGTASAHDPCAPAGALLDEHELAKARDAFMDVKGPDNGCVRLARNLATISRALAAEKRLCAEGAVLAGSGKDDEAQRAYVRALEVNVASACAKKGMAEPKGWAENANGWLTEPTKFAVATGKILLTFVGIVILFFFFLAARRRSLVVSDLADGASKTSKVGTAVTALIQKRLIGLGRASQRGPDYAYDLDVVAADVEHCWRARTTSRMRSRVWPTRRKLGSVWRACCDLASRDRQSTADRRAGELLLPGGPRRRGRARAAAAQ